tara:strand:- start:41 stop:427 length:387 start_codon:yes stop_codon:yes gene_type:complete
MRRRWDNIIWIAVIMTCFIFISGCAIGEKRVKLFTIEEPRAPLDLDNPKPLNLDDLKWIIITSENADEVFARLEKEGYDPVLFGLTDKEYELIAKNFAKIRNHLMQTNELLEKYKEYYEPEVKNNKSK